jgi:hypothetical protein
MTGKDIAKKCIYFPDEHCPNFHRGDYNMHRLCRMSGGICRLPNVMNGYCSFFNDTVFGLYFIDCMKKEFGSVLKEESIILEKEKEQ